jgi:acyl carrier protein
MSDWTLDGAWESFVEVVADVLEREPDDVERDMDFRDDLEIDSLGVVELMLELEDVFDIDIDEKDAEAVSTTTEGFALVCGHLGL